MSEVIELLLSETAAADIERRSLLRNPVNVAGLWRVAERIAPAHQLHPSATAAERASDSQ
jgi:hypothetical protein